MSDATARLAHLENELNDFDPAVRSRALAELLTLADAGAIALAPEAAVANMHCHTFFSFNAYGHSPTSLAWLARRRGYRLVGIVDFDVLDGVDEFLGACEQAGVRGSAGIETRVYIPAYVAHEINSPGEPGVAYHMGVGLPAGRVPAGVAGLLADLGRRAGERNRAVVARVNAYLHPIAVNYEHDVLPLTPAGNPTERHIVVAYVRAAGRLADPAGFWAGRLGMDAAATAAAMAHPAGPGTFQNLVRARLMKQGGPGYVKPESGVFPTMADLHRLVVGCGGLPCGAWLDGTSAAERDAATWLQFLVGQGVLALNIIPDRNWNLPDAEQRRRKVENLGRVVDTALALDLPLNVGTEMNSFGQKPVDDFQAPELAPFRQAFLDGAHCIYGHTVLQRALGKGYVSAWARDCLPGRGERNAFYTRVGYAVPPGAAAMARLARLDPDLTPAELLRQLQAR